MRHLVLTLLCGALTAACGHEIGDSCGNRSDCDPAGGRACDTASPDGYCTILGCDATSCPEEAVCVSFYTGDFSNKPCVQATEDVSTDDCSTVEACTISGYCAPRTSEIRYCMRTCGSTADCRESYECRDLSLMRTHGGEPVTETGDQTPFCAAAP